MKIGITGSEGLLGWHARAYLKTIGAHEVRLANRATFADAKTLEDFVSGLDAIFHFAGMNRGTEAEIEATNKTLAQDVVSACVRVKAAPFIVFANSTHHAKDTAYGRGKREAASVFQNWNKERFANVILPHVFGEFGKPFYNSVVSTFCHQLSQGEAPRIEIDGDLELVHAQEVAALFLSLAQGGNAGELRMEGAPMKVSELLGRLGAMQASYKAMIIPRLDDPLEARLFNTLRSYLFPGHYPVPLKLHSDARGSLFETVKSQGGGQSYLSTTHTGITRGHHFHTRKTERFLVVGGEAEIRLRKLFSSEIIRFHVHGDAPCFIDMPTFYTHSITNTGKSELITLFWANEIFDPADSDTFPEPVDIA